MLGDVVQTTSPPFHRLLFRLIDRHRLAFRKPPLPDRLLGFCRKFPARTYDIQEYDGLYPANE
jgi:hypothetical protein